MWQVLSEPFGRQLSATLLHFVWQGALIAAAAAALLRILQSSAPHIRYAVGYGALVLMAVAPLVTWPLVRLPAPQASPPIAAAPIAAAEPAALGAAHAGTRANNLASRSSPAYSPATGLPATQPADSRSATSQSAVQSSIVPVEASAPASVAHQSLTQKFAAWIVPLQPYLLGAWFLGVALCASRLLAGIGGIWWLRGARSAVPVWLNVSLIRLGRRLGINAAARVYASPRVDEAVALGFWRPIVLVPMSWLTELPAEMVEAIVAHELAHIRRFDLWAVFGQRLVETVLFYHPAVWWLSRRISTEREMCCDAVAAAAIGSRSIYVRALETVGRRSRRDVAAGRSQQRSPQTVSYALATSFRGEEEMVLLKRVRQVLGLRAQSEAGRAWPAGALIAALALGAWTIGAGIGESAEGDKPREGDKPKAEAGREGDKPKAEAGRQGGDKPKAEGERKEGERKPGEASRREGAAREGAAREGAAREGAARDGERRPAEATRGEEPSRRNSEARHQIEDFKPQTDREEALLKMIIGLRSELATLRRQAEAGRTPGAREAGTREGGARPAARDGEGAPRTGARDGDRPAGATRDGERPKAGPRDGEGAPRTGPRDGERRPEGARDGERRPAEGERKEGERRPAEGEAKPRIDG